MSDKLGKLAQSTSTTSATVYTVGAAKCAKHRLMWRATFAGGATFEIFVNETKIMTATTLTGEYFSTFDTLITGPSTPSGASDATTVAPYEREYFSSTTDVVRFAISVGTCSAMSFQVVGAELDV